MGCQVADSASDLCKQLQTHREAIEQNLNLSDLIPRLHQNEIIPDLETGIADKSRPNQDRTKELISLIMVNDAMLHKKFLKSLDDENQHLGHRYIWCLLNDQKYADEEDISTASKIKEQIRKNMRKVVKGMKLERALIDHLYQKKLLTESEFEELSENRIKGNNDKNQTVLKWLYSKGPTAHLIFAQCLKEETEHRTHRELYQLISGESVAEASQQKLPVTTRKRQLEDGEQPLSVRRREPSRLAIEGELKTVKYLEIMKQIRQYINKGEWKAVEDTVCQSASKSVELHVAILLESCTGLIIRKQRDRVIEVVAEARELCSKIDNNCRTYLHGRCEYTMARMHQYANESDNALKCIRKAGHIQFNVEFGEDTALRNYCNGCILIECFANSTDSCEFEFTDAEKFLESAILSPHTSKMYGLNAAHPKIRLAQLYLGSSSHRPGIMTDSKRLEKAQYYLKEAAVPSVENLAPRTQCIYYYTQSDLHRNKGELEEARSSAQKALDIAEENGFTTEIESANVRLSQMVHT